MTVAQDILKAETPAYVELFQLQYSASREPALANLTHYLTPMLDDIPPNTPAKVLFGGIEYTPYPVAISDVEQSTDGAPNRPKLSLANINKYIGSLAFLYDIRGTRVRYIRTFSTYLNQQTALSLPILTFEIARTITHNKKLIVFELKSMYDNERLVMPRRQMLAVDFPGLGVNKQNL